ncbi:MAG: FIST C-terminal domain-containing protein [Candidatus Rokubacteria bacterium]|nr:FIST C-terminal domain-containing protein [Candidatus Rokubacteria bacterium]
MATTAGVGYSENPQSREAGIEAASAALKEAGVAQCDLAIMSSTGKHDPRQLCDGVRSVIGPAARLIGGCSMGVITRDRLGYLGYQVGVAVVASDSVNVDMFMEKNLPDREYEVGLALGKQIRSKAYEGEPNILLLYDAGKEARTAEGVVLNFATPLLEGLGQALKVWPPAAGIGLVDDIKFNPTYQWFDGRIEQGTAMALVLSGGVRMDTIIIHGCKPAGAYHTVTKAEGATIFEIDDRPALEVIAELLGPDSDKSWENYPLWVTLGTNRGDKFGEFREEDYANRMCMAVDRERRALVMFEPNLKTGSEVQLMRRSMEFDYIRRRAEILYQRIGSRRPFLAIYFDCAGRVAAFCGTEREEAEEVQKVIGPRMPLLGMYSGVEIAKVRDDMEALDWTGVLCVFSE